MYNLLLPYTFISSQVHVLLPWALPSSVPRVPLGLFYGQIMFSVKKKNPPASSSSEPEELSSLVCLFLLASGSFPSPSFPLLSSFFFLFSSCCCSALLDSSAARFLFLSDSVESLRGEWGTTGDINNHLSEFVRCLLKMYGCGWNINIISI